MPIDRAAVKQDLLEPEEQESTLDRDAVKRALSTRKGRRDARAAKPNDPAAILGGEFDPESFAPTGLRFDLSRGDTMEEKQLRFKRRFPEGELREVNKSLILGGPDSPTLVFRESPEDKFKQVDPPTLEVGDLVEALGPSVEAIAGETAAQTLGNILGKGKATVPIVVLRQALGALFGEGVEQTTQTLTDKQLQSFGEGLQEAGTEFLMSGAGGFLASPAVGVRNLASGRGVLDISEQGQRSLQAASRISDDIGERVKLTPGSVSPNPLLARQEAQAAVLVTGFKERYSEIAGQLDKAVENAKPRSVVRSGVIDRTMTRLKDFGRQFVNRLGVNRTSRTAGGKALQQGRENFATVSKAIENNLYDVARSIEEPRFNLEPLGMVSASLRANRRLDNEVRKLTTDLDAIDGPIDLPNGDVLSVTDQLRAIRTDARKIAQGKVGEASGTREHHAGLLADAVKRVLDNPLNQDPSFKKAWAAASESTKYRRSVLDADAMIRIAKSEEPARLLQFARPDNSEALKLFRDSIDSKTYEAFRSSVQTDMLSDLSNLGNRLDQFAGDPETLNLLIHKKQQAAWRKVAGELDRINALDVEDIALKQVGNKEFMRKLVSDPNPNTAFTLQRAINQSNDEALRNTVRVAVLDYAWDGAVQVQKDGIKINRRLVQRNLDALEKSRMLGFLTKKQRQTLMDVDQVAASLERIADAGTSIRGMEVASQLPGELVTLNFTGSAARSFLQSYGISRFYLSPLGEKILLGSGKPSSKGEVIRLLGASLTRLGANEDLSQAVSDKLSGLSAEEQNGN